MRWAARTDATHAAIRDALRAQGWLVFDCARLKGFVDLVAYHPATGRYRLIDAKSKGGKARPSQQKLVRDGWPVEFLSEVE